MGGLLRGSDSGREVVCGVEAGCQLDPGPGIFRTALRGGLCCQAGIAELARREAGGGENRPGAGGIRIEACGIRGGLDRFLKFPLEKEKFPQPLRGIGVLGVEAIGLFHFQDGLMVLPRGDEQSGQETVWLGLEGILQDREANVGFRVGHVLKGESCDRATQEEAGVVRVFFDDLGDRFFRLGEILVEDGLFSRGDGGIEEGVFVRPFREGSNIEKGTFLAGGIPQVGKGSDGHRLGPGGSPPSHQGKRPAGGEADDLVKGIENGGAGLARHEGDGGGKDSVF